jgi:hypothetical protein
MIIKTAKSNLTVMKSNKKMPYCHQPEVSLFNEIVIGNIVLPIRLFKKHTSALLILKVLSITLLT